MKTRQKKFDAVAESRRWREQTSALLASLTPSERITFLNRRIADFPKTKAKSSALVVAESAKVYGKR